MIIPCPRCGARLAECPDGRRTCLLCARYYRVDITEDPLGPYTQEEEQRNLLEFLADTAPPPKQKE